MKRSGKPGILAGALVGVMLTAAMIGVYYAAWQLADLPFVPFDVFDWTTRVLPGQVIAFGIGSMVAIIRLLHVGPTSVVAKMAEQAMGIAGLFVTGVVGGAVLFGILRVLRGRFAYPLGLIMGIAVGVPVMLISHSVSHTAAVSPTASAVWILVTFILWGVAFGRIYQQLLAASVPAPDVSAAPPSVERVSRRRFLIRLGGMTAAITVAGAVVGALTQRRRGGEIMAAGGERWSATNALPNAGAAVQPAPGTRAEYTPLEQHYRIDINTIPPTLDGQQWRLKVGGLVDKPLELSLDELRSYEPMHQFVTLSCISNPIGGDLTGTTRWTGVSLQRLLPSFILKPEATHLKIRSTDGFYEIVPLDVIRSDERVMLVYAWDGVPLPVSHGFPLRIYIPDVYGMKQPKWIETIEATDHWEPGYWVVRGWDKVARMKATSVIDTVGMDMNIITASQGTPVSIGGIAHAGARGISRVEVQVNGGEWQQAALRTPLSDLTWVLWRYDWPFAPGEHTFTVRCYDGSSTPQIVTPAPPEPTGASGLHSLKQRF